MLRLGMVRYITPACCQTITPQHLLCILTRSLSLLSRISIPTTGLPYHSISAHLSYYYRRILHCTISFFVHSITRLSSRIYFHSVSKHLECCCQSPFGLEHPLSITVETLHGVGCYFFSWLGVPPLICCVSCLCFLYVWHTSFLRYPRHVSWLYDKI